VQVDQLSEELVAGLTLPRNERGWRYGLAAGYKRQDIQNEERTDWGVTGTHAYLIEEYLSQQSLQLIEENRRVANVSEENIIALYLAQNWNWNDLDDLLAPRKGYFLGLEVGASSEDIVSDASFGRVVGKASYFLPVRTFGTVVLRLEAGSVIADSRDNVPSAYLFRTGGDTTVRGYEYQSLGVRVGDAVVGGRYLLVGSVEYIQWLTQQLGAAVFYDAGNAVDTTSNFEAAAGYGVGARWYSPIGALNFDVAYGEEVDEYRIHFTAGFVFR
jgi:translocation and assembly module TamA